MSSTNIQESTRRYELWLRKQMPLLPADIQLKHERMARSAFEFLRATFYRWAQLWPEVCPDLDTSPPVLGVGDIHVENFGTWRDSEGRLIWGINDFDEACILPYANDLVRLATSAYLAGKESQLLSELEPICQALLTGYTEAFAAQGRPFVLAEHHGWLRNLALSELRDPERFWGKLFGLPRSKSPIPSEVRTALGRALPETNSDFRIVHRQAGLGSLGRRRFTAVAEWRGGLVAREAKEMTGSAWLWARGKAGGSKIAYLDITENAVRVPDPFLRIQGNWVVRRIAPDCSRIELSSVSVEKHELKVLHAMGWETANVHLGSSKFAKEINKHLSSTRGKWLAKATLGMAKAVVKDWENWKGSR